MNSEVRVLEQCNTTVKLKNNKALDKNKIFYSNSRWGWEGVRRWGDEDVEMVF